MGLNIQSDDFWALRPDNFMVMYRGYRMKQQQDYFPLRRLMAIAFSAAGGSLSEEAILPLPLLDPPKLKKAPRPQLTAQQVAEIERRHKERQERIKQRKLNG